ncbi:hypothetical protein NDU88_005836 [Pleurodeles waltl]|uniref:Nuclease HARBI1 n=1 Tax=Pleurodeles waltl TaxID=8319 RepID=A0AAV7LMJ5_PLEWA|nr:hypothetical protein NDU88_005836 [Pleurodeles waltl]
MAVTSAAVTSAVVRIITAGTPFHWLLGPIGSYVNQCSIALRSTTAYREGVQRQRSYPTIPLSQRSQLGHLRRWRNPPVYRPLVDLLTMEERHLIVTYRFDRATIQELCTQLEPGLMSPLRHPTGIPPDMQVLSVLHFLASGSFQTTVAMASGMSQPMFSNVLSRVLSALLKHVPFLQEDGPDDGVVAAVEPVEPVDSDEGEAEEEDNDSSESVIQQYFQ